MSLSIPSGFRGHVTSHPATLSKRAGEDSPVKEIDDWIDANGLSWWKIPSCIYMPIKLIPECQASEDANAQGWECEYKPYDYERAKCRCDSGAISRKRESYDWEVQCVDARCGEQDGWWLKCTHLRRQKDVQEACGLFLPKAREQMVNDYGEEFVAEIDEKYPFDEEKERIEIPSVCDQFPTTKPSETESAGPRTTIKISSDGTTTTVEVSSSPRAGGRPIARTSALLFLGVLACALAL